MKKVKLHVDVTRGNSSKREVFETFMDVDTLRLISTDKGQKEY